MSCSAILVTPGDEIDEHAEERCHDHEQQPQRLEKPPMSWLRKISTMMRNKMMNHNTHMKNRKTWTKRRPTADSHTQESCRQYGNQAHGPSKPLRIKMVICPARTVLLAAFVSHAAAKPRCPE